MFRNVAAIGGYGKQGGTYEADAVSACSVCTSTVTCKTGGACGQ